MRQVNELKASVFGYLKETDPDYAIMITGQWGSGKTYFWKHSISPIIQRQRQIPLYITLYGIEDKKQIDDLIALELYPFLKTPTARIALKLAKIPLTIFRLRPMIEDFSLREWIRLTNCVLCFDDLERSQLGLEEMLGYINRFVEHKRVKTIIICNEERIANDDYNQQKEKIVGLSLEYTPDMEKVVESIVSVYVKNRDYFNFLTESKKLILDVVARSESNNVRILKAALNYFRDVFANLREGGKVESYGGAFLKFTLSVAFALREGTADETQLEELITDRDGSVAFNYFDKEKNEQQKSYLEQYIEKYYDGVSGLVQALFSISIYNYVRKGFFDEEMFQEEIRFIESRQSSPEQMKIDTLVRGFWELPDDEFSVTASDVLQMVRKGEIESLEQYLTLCQQFLTFSGEGVITENPGDIRDIFMAGLKVALKTKKLEYRESLGQFSLRHEPQEQEYKDVKESIFDINRSLKESEVETKAQKLFQLLPTSIVEFVRQISDHKEGEFSKLPVFKYCNVKEVSEKILNLENKDIVRLRNAIVNRYDLVNIGASLGDDRENLVKITRRIDTHLKKVKSDGKLSTMLLRALRKSLSEASNKLKKQKPQKADSV